MGVRVLLTTATTHILGETAGSAALASRTAARSKPTWSSSVAAFGPTSRWRRRQVCTVEKAIVVDDQLRTSDPTIFAVGECAQHRGRLYGLVDPIYEQARVLADVLTEAKPEAAYTGSRLATTLKVMGVDLLSMGEPTASGAEHEVISHLNPHSGVYKKLIFRAKRLIGAILLGET